VHEEEQNIKLRAYRV